MTRQIEHYAVEDIGGPDGKPEPEYLEKEQFGLAGLLLHRMGIPEDRDKLARIAANSVELPELQPPFTAAKIAGALAKIALKLASGQMQPAQANATLFALQTLIGAVRVSIQEEKWNARKAAAQKRQTRSTRTGSTRNSKTPASRKTRRPKPQR